MNAQEKVLTDTYPKILAPLEGAISVGNAVTALNPTQAIANDIAKLHFFFVDFLNPDAQDRANARTHVQAETANRLLSSYSTGSSKENPKEKIALPAKQQEPRGLKECCFASFTGPGASSSLLQGGRSSRSGNAPRAPIERGGAPAPPGVGGAFPENDNQPPAT